MPVVLLDTCVLYPAHLRDTLLVLAQDECFEPRWSSQILEELSRNLISKKMNSYQFDRLSDQMNIAFPQANVINFELHIDEMTCHAKDRHVLAAAVECDADLIVTFNIRDFPTAVCDALGVGVLHPDDFLLDLFVNGPDRVIGALIRQCERNVRFPQTFDQLLDVLIRGGVPRFGANIRDLIGK